MPVSDFDHERTISDHRQNVRSHSWHFDLPCDGIKLVDGPCRNPFFGCAVKSARVIARITDHIFRQRQLLAFARAIYRDAPLLVLDEATASVDSDTEARLHVALEEVMRDRTSLVIAHRLSTIRAADRIVVFHKGRVVEVGSHDELLAKDGVYARLYKMQFAHEQGVAAEARLKAVPEPQAATG